MRIIICFIAFILIIAGCKKNTLPDPVPTDIQLRIQNATPWDFTNCIIDPPGVPSSSAGPAPFNYGSIDVNKISSYHKFESLYSYAYVSLNMNGIAYVLQPYDYFGEEPLGNGKYTYKISYLWNTDRLFVELIKD